MLYQKIRPFARLRPYIEGIWLQEDLTHTALGSYPPTKVLPNGCIEAAFYYKDRFVEIRDGHSAAKLQKAVDSWQ